MAAAPVIDLQSIPPPQAPGSHTPLDVMVRAGAMSAVDFFMNSLCFEREFIVENTASKMAIRKLVG